MISADKHYEIHEPPKTVGSWRMPCSNIYFHCHEKPRWLTRFLAKWLFEMEWKDACK